jgi:hypothetical protein
MELPAHLVNQPNVAFWKQMVPPLAAEIRQRENTSKFIGELNDHPLDKAAANALNNQLWNAFLGLN